MAMLAESRSRKGYTLTPRGKAMYEDDTRYGTKMLEKMGWSKGKGLGANEDGVQDFVRLRFKDQSHGLGYVNRDDQWTEHSDSFEGLLRSLNDECGDNQRELAPKEDIPTRGFGFAAVSQEIGKKMLKEKLSGESLEKKSKVSKSRVHYKKFTKGKDLTQYSEKDLANIFGMKAGEERILENVVTENNFASSTISVHDYFKQKMDAMKEKKNMRLNEVLSDSIKEETILENSVTKKRKINEGSDLKNDKQEQQNDVKFEDHMGPKAKKVKKNKKGIQSVLNNINETEGICVAEEEAEPRIPPINKNIIEHNQEIVVNSENKHSIEQKIRKNKKQSTSNQTREEAKANTTIKMTEENCVAEEAEPRNPPLNKTIIENNQEIVINSEDKDNIEQKIKKISKNKKQSTSNQTREEAKANITIKVHKTEKNKCQHDFVNDNKTTSPNVETHFDMKKKKSKKTIRDVESSADITDSNTVPKHQLKSKSSDVISEEPSQDLLAKIQSYDLYTISTFAAEKFRLADLEHFNGSNLAQIVGYSFNNSLKVKVKKIERDEERITQLWTCTLDKYKNAAPKNSFYRYAKEVRDARKSKKKLPRFNVKTWKRKQAFQSI